MARKKTARVTLTGRERIVAIFGKEDFLRSYYLSQLRQTMEQAIDQEIDQLRFDGNAAGLSDVLDELRSVGLMGQHKLVIVDDAEKFLSNHREALERYARKPEEAATLVLRSEGWRPGNLDKQIEKVGAVIRCEPVSPDGAARWAVNRASKEYASDLKPAAASALVEQVGNDLARLDSELSKLAACVGGGRPIEAEDVHAMAGHASDEQAWAISEALLSGDPRRAVAKVDELIELAGQPRELVGYFLADTMRKLAEAAALLEQNVPPDSFLKPMKIWGPRRGLFLTAAGRLGAARAAMLLKTAVEADRRAKSGFGEARSDPPRSLERLCVLFCHHLR